jgi:hypothetical protein
MKVILQHHILIVGITKEEALIDVLKLIVEKLKGISIRKLNQWVLQITNSFKHLIGNYKMNREV